MSEADEDLLADEELLTHWLLGDMVAILKV